MSCVIALSVSMVFLAAGYCGVSFVLQCLWLHLPEGVEFGGMETWVQISQWPAPMQERA